MYVIYVYKWGEDDITWKDEDKKYFRRAYMDEYKVEPILDDIGISTPIGYLHSCSFIKGWIAARNYYY